MTRRDLSQGEDLAGGDTYVTGDFDPVKFDYNDKLSRSTLLSLLIRNGKIQKGTVWTAGEMIRARWAFKKPQPVDAPKHGPMFHFETFDDWLEWIGFIQELLKVLFWSLLFGEAILVFYTGKEVMAKELTLKEAGELSFVSCKAYYPITKQNGYQIQDVNTLLNRPATYKIMLQAHKASGNMEIIAPFSRVVRFSAPAKELKYSGTSNVSSVAKDCIGQENIKRGIVSAAKNLLPGIIAAKAETPAEAAKVNAMMGDTLNHMHRIFFRHPEDAEHLIKLIIPDMKITQVKELNGILQTDIGTSLDIALSLIEGAPQGIKASAAWDTFNTYSKIKQLQSHYKHAMEETFFKLGKEDTCFTWNDPTPQLPKSQGDPEDKKPEDQPGDDPSIPTNEEKEEVED